ncbi:thiamine-phosphate kinase [Candidatus Phycosocius spiralis]|uniref:Thiamine-monophosphate kinase n=1 Tax=Candidatus Phycosocius spiralis TaxID=2815099 RepID=A0ABQ4PSB1_9PROT|nr:thiamine-phosphate kinase [Candidatus Phycosocius spiralis]GIU65897.1 thiamine-monophosphate kinase [Candidatus Phycosocius spiralis]
MTQKSLHEFGMIKRLLAPLTLGVPGAFELKDDVAQLPHSAYGQVVTCDQIIEGTHFFPDDPLDLVAKHLVRRNLSDLIAKGCRPRGALLTLAWPKAWSLPRLALFIKGLGEDLAELGDHCPLYGGDTSQTSGPLVASLTLIGEPLAASHAPILRSGAKPGDHVYVTGVIGDAYLGLEGRLGKQSVNDLKACQGFALAPLPTPLAMSAPIAHYAHASIDISDGLLADAAHLATNSRVRIELALDCIPLSSEASQWVEKSDNRVDALLNLATGGEDYQALMCVSAEQSEDFINQAQRNGTRLSKVGQCWPGQGLTISYLGQVIRLPKKMGWSVSF